MEASPAWLSIFFNQSKSSGWANGVEDDSGRTGSNLPLRSSFEVAANCSEAGSSKEEADAPPRLFNQLKSSCGAAGGNDVGSSKVGAGVPPRLFNQLKSSCEGEDCDGKGSLEDGSAVPPKLLSQLKSSGE